MFAVLGAAGNVGFATSSALREAGVPVRAIIRDPAKAGKLDAIGYEVVVADLQDPLVLATAIEGADAVQVIAPLSPHATDPAADLRRSIDSIVEAVVQARTKRLLAISDYGAHVVEDIGMPSIFHHLEARLAQLDARTVVLRSAEHMHNWARGIPAAIESGNLPTLHQSLDAEFPNIAASDRGRISAALLLEDDAESRTRIVHAEGPRRYSANDVAKVVSDLSGRPVAARTIPRPQWDEAFRSRMPASLAALLIGTNDAQNGGGLVDIEPGVRDVRHGTTDLAEALRPFVPQR